MPPADGRAGSARVAILLSTYNGSRYLPEQLASFSAQENVVWTLHWRDDGSQDDTQAVMRVFAATAEGRCIEHPDDCGNLGVLASYMLLLRAVAPGLDEHDSVAFADQDDVWLPGKLAFGAAALAARRGPALYCARYVLADATLRQVGTSEKLRRPAGFPQALTQNIATGCTILLNREATLLVAASAPPPGTLHDWWCYLVVAASGGAVIRDETPVLLYRQHASNTVGATPNWLRRGLAAWRRGPAAFMGLLRAHIAALLSRPALLSEVALRDLTRLDAAVYGDLPARLAALAIPAFRRQGWWETFVFRVWFVTHATSGKIVTVGPDPTARSGPKLLVEGSDGRIKSDHDRV